MRDLAKREKDLSAHSTDAGLINNGKIITSGKDQEKTDRPS